MVVCCKKYYKSLFYSFIYFYYRLNFFFSFFFQITGSGLSLPSWLNKSPLNKSDILLSNESGILFREPSTSWLTAVRWTSVTLFPVQPCRSFLWRWIYAFCVWMVGSQNTFFFHKTNDINMKLDINTLEALDFSNLNFPRLNCGDFKCPHEGSFKTTEAFCSKARRR